jgi:hypothetical protein
VAIDLADDAAVARRLQWLRTAEGDMWQELREQLSAVVASLGRDDRSRPVRRRRPRVSTRQPMSTSSISRTRPRVEPGGLVENQMTCVMVAPPLGALRRRMFLWPGAWWSG